jgi:hypothetical protein
MIGNVRFITGRLLDKSDLLISNFTVSYLSPLPGKPTIFLHEYSPAFTIVMMFR